MKWFLVFVIVTINVTMNLVWILGFAKCTPLEKVFDAKVPGTCWDKKKLGKYQLFASCKATVTSAMTNRYTNGHLRLFRNLGLRPGLPALANPDKLVYDAS